MVLLLKLWGYLKNYLWIGIIILALWLVGKWGWDRITYLEKENKRQIENIKNKELE